MGSGMSFQAHREVVSCYDHPEPGVLAVEGRGEMSNRNVGWERKNQQRASK